MKRAHLRLTWREATRRRDPDNIVAAKKFLLDGLVQAGVLSDDGWAEVAGFEERWEVSSEPGVLIELTEVE